MPPEAQQERLREREGEVVRIIEAIKRLETSEDWSTLKTEVFDGALDSLEGRLMSESKKSELNNPEMYRLQGRIHQAKKYDFVSLLSEYRLELIRIRQQLT